MKKGVCCLKTLKNGVHLDKCPEIDPRHLDKCIIGFNSEYVKILVEINEDMKRSMEKQYYLYELDDYSAPSCTSSTKFYFGTLDDFRRMLNVAGTNQSDLEQTFERFEKGEKDITHIVCYNPQPFAIPATVIKQKTLQYNTHGFRYKNPYGFYYLARADYTIITLYLIKCQRFYYTCYQMSINNPRYSDDIDKKEIPIEPPFWGFPGLIVVTRDENDEICFENTLLETERIFKTKAEALEHYDMVKNIDLTAFYEDIFGDG